MVVFMPDRYSLTFISRLRVPLLAMLNRAANQRRADARARGDDHPLQPLGGRCEALHAVARPFDINSLGSDAGLHEATAPADAEGVLAILEVAIVRLFRSKILHMFESHTPKLTREG